MHFVIYMNSALFETKFLWFHRPCLFEAFVTSQLVNQLYIEWDRPSSPANQTQTLTLYSELQLASRCSESGTYRVKNRLRRMALLEIPWILHLIQLQDVMKRHASNNSFFYLSADLVQSQMVIKPGPRHNFKRSLHRKWSNDFVEVVFGFLFF